MLIRKTRMEDMGAVMQIYCRAAAFMTETGNPNQWMDGYPQQELIEKDILAGVSYVMEEEGVVEAVFSFIIGEDPTYLLINQGNWISNEMYGTIHRIASAGRRKGIAKMCFDWCAATGAQQGCRSIRVDTHQDNRIMQHVVEKSGFSRCGIIYLANGAPRIAYEKLCQSPQSVPPQSGMPSYGAGAQPGQSVPPQPPYGGWQPVQEKKNGNGYGVAALILGILSLLLFCTCINWILAILAIIFAIVQLLKYEEKGLAIGGIITAGISLLFSIMFMMFFVISVPIEDDDSYGDSYDYYDDYYEDYYNDYYDEYFDEYDYDDEYDEYYDEYDEYFTAPENEPYKPLRMTE